MSTNRETLRLYWQQVKKYKPSFFVMLICIPTGALFIGTVVPYFLAQAIGALSSGNEARVAEQLWLAGGAGVIGVLGNLFGFQAIARHEASIRSDLSDATFRSIINKDLRFFVDTKVGALTTRYIDFIRSHVTLQDLFIIRTLGFVLSVGLGLIILFLASPVVGGIVLLLIVALILQVRWSIKKRTPWRQERKRLVGEIHGHVADAVTNNLVVKTFAGEQREEDALRKMNRTFKAIFIKDIGFVALEGTIRIGLMTAASIIAVVVATQLVFHGQLTVATAIFVLAYLQQISSRIFELGDMLNGYDQALLDAAPMSDMLTSPVAVEDAKHSKALVVNRPTIHLDDVSYAYPNNHETIIKELQLEVPAGQKAGLVGHSGSGKTTLTHLLLRFADTTAGAITIDGQDIRSVTQASLRTQVAYVPQEPALFHRTLRDNIAYGRPGASEAEVVAAAKQAHAWEFISTLPDGLDTLVGERGVKLSGGQRQRIAIARAILKDAPILVLDEATSALDSESEKLIQDSLGELMKGRTAIVIAHRLSTIAKLDRIIVLDKGKIVEDGTHKELLEKDGVYAKLWAHQSGGFIEE